MDDGFFKEQLQPLSHESSNCANLALVGSLPARPSSFVEVGNLYYSSYTYGTEFSVQLTLVRRGISQSSYQDYAGIL